MPSCSAYRCRNRSEDAKKKGLTFHRFPASDPKRLRQWVINMKWDKWMPSKRSLLCSSHFQEDCFDRSGLTVRLTPSAVPTIFSFPAHLQKVLIQMFMATITCLLEYMPHKGLESDSLYTYIFFLLFQKSLGRKPPKRPVITATPTMSLKSPSIATVSGNTVPTLFRKMVVNEHNYAVLESSRQLKQKLDILNEQLDIYQKKLSNERKESARLKKKACHLVPTMASTLPTTRFEPMTS
uniref:THAP-type domain-containing protein n=1 Tax=Paramormyrops kingsleyae TaxID=1676925 RepID=A0A3B3T7W2_9TELE